MTAAVLLPTADAGTTARSIGRLLRPRAWVAALAALSMVAAASAGILVPVVIGRIVDLVLVDAPTADLRISGLILLLLAVANSVATLLASLLIARFGEPAVADLRELVMERALNLDAGRVESSGSGDLLARLERDVSSLSVVVRTVLSEFTAAAFALVLTVVGLSVLDPRFALVLLVVVPVQVWASRRYLARARTTYADLAHTQGAESQAILESLGGVPTIRALGLGTDRLAVLRQQSLGVRDLEIDAVRLRAAFFQRLNLAEFLGTSALLAIGLWLARDGSVTAGEATAAALMFIRLFNPINVVLGLLDEVQSAAAGMARLVGVLETSTTPRGNADLPPGAIDVRLEGVDFGYTSESMVLHHVDLHIGAGERIALVGQTGAGKSTVGSVIAGLREPHGGRVLVGGVGTLELSRAQLRSAVGLVAQEPHIFNGPLRDDLTLAAPGTDDDVLLAALARVGAGSWAASLPDGLDTRVGAGGHGLTPVQSQQVALARVLLSDPPVVILDEATAEADSAAAHELETAVDAVAEGRTAVLVAHRLSHAASCDRVVVLEEGRIVELGSHDELLEIGGTYAGLWAAWDTRGAIRE